MCGRCSKALKKFLQSKKMQKLIQIEKKVIDEAEPLTELFMDILSNKLRVINLE
jgi:hypothetical protein